jgi:hypothetical protein
MRLMDECPEELDGTGRVVAIADSEAHASVSLISSQSLYSNVSFVVVAPPGPEPDCARSAMEVVTMFEMSDAARRLVVVAVSVSSPGRGSGRGRGVP